MVQKSSSGASRTWEASRIYCTEDTYKPGKKKAQGDAKRKARVFGVSAKLCHVRQPKIISSSVWFDE